MNRIIKAAFTALVLLAACSGTKEDNAAKQTEGAQGSDSLSHQDLYHLAAVELVGRFSRDLRAELVAAINDSGSPANAIRVCRTKSPEMVVQHSTGGWSIRRVTDRPRNEANLVSTEQADILAKFAEPSSAPAFVENWTEGGDSQTYRFYAPIRTSAFCLNCHGDANSLAPGVATALDTLYPDDKAIGYKDDQLRGMFVIEAAYPQGTETARMLISARDSL